MKLILNTLKNEPIFLCIDDMMVTELGKKFEDVSKLFSHVAHNDPNYLNGHCFTSLMLSVLIWNKRLVSYLAVPLGFWLWKKTDSKLAMAARMMKDIMPFLEKKQTILLCDSWYTKTLLLLLVDHYNNLDVICNARIDSVLYDLTSEPTGKRLSSINDFNCPIKKLAPIILVYSQC